MGTPQLPPLPAIYEDYAAVYDRTGQIRFSILMDMYCARSSIGTLLQANVCWILPAAQAHSP